MMVDFVVITAGIDLSVVMVFVLTNCLSSWIVVGTGATAALGVVGVLLNVLACGAINGLIVIYGRLQPIVATIASGASAFGVALLLRPIPGGDVYGPLADGLTGRIFGVAPASLAALRVVVLVLWIPYRRSAIGRAVYAVCSWGNRSLHVRFRSTRPVLRLPAFRIDSRRSAACSSLL